MGGGTEGESHTASIRFMVVLISLIPYPLIIQTPSLAGQTVTGKQGRDGGRERKG